MTRDRKTYRLAHWLASFILAAVLLSGCHKILYPADFALAVYRFHLLPGFLVNAGSLYFQWLEMACAVCLLFIPKYRVAALWIVLVLLAIFTGGIAINLLRGSVFSCGCFSNSPIARPMDWLNVARNIALMALVGLALHGWRKSNV
ncbi:MAG: MauE/DoxX family redox-associated membrane protein [Verrucomicrobiota bacterium]|nr:MauE/DoxX family redox-associated membrane protein [Verrucomicrobiota bacterium]